MLFLFFHLILLSFSIESGIRIFNDSFPNWRRGKKKNQINKWSIFSRKATDEYTKYRKNRMYNLIKFRYLFPFLNLFCNLFSFFLANISFLRIILLFFGFGYTLRLYVMWVRSACVCFSPNIDLIFIFCLLFSFVLLYIYVFCFWGFFLSLIRLLLFYIYIYIILYICYKTLWNLSFLLRLLLN